MTSPPSASPSSSSSRRFFGEEWLPTRIPGGGRQACAYASLDDKRHFLFGGWDTKSRCNTVVVYNSTLQNWRTHPPLPKKRCFSAATAIDDERFLVVGGSNGIGPIRNTCFVYDSRSRKWSPIGLVSTLAVVVTRPSTPTTRKPT